MTHYATTLDASALSAWLTQATTAVIAARSQIDAVNVYPVADADTGTNLSLTLIEGRAEVASSEQSTVRDLLGAFAQGALLGARGNSGVIVSQFFRGMALSASDETVMTPRSLAQALELGSTEARLAVSIPVEGTILTVLSAGAAAASKAAAADGDMVAVVNAVALAARKALWSTPGQLIQLQEAGVLDAGALGMVIILDELAAVISGTDPEPLTIEPPSFEGAADSETVDAAQFEVMYVLRAKPGPTPDMVDLRERLDEIGESVVVVGGDGLWQVHVHTNRPDLAIAAGAGLGIRRQLTVRHLADPGRHEEHSDQPTPFGLVVCTAAPLLVARLALTGAVVLAEPSGRCPSVSELRRAVRETGAERVAIVPGDSRVAAVAHELVGTHSKALTPGMLEPAAEVVEAFDLVSSLICASVYRHGTTDSAEDQMEAIRVALDGVRVAELPELAPTATAAELRETVTGLVESVVREQTELVTVVRGDVSELGDGIEAEVTSAVTRIAPEAEVLVLSGGQGSPAIVVGAE